MPITIGQLEILAQHFRFDMGEARMILGLPVKSNKKDDTISGIVSTHTKTKSSESNSSGSNSSGSKSSGNKSSGSKSSGNKSSGNKCSGSKSSGNKSSESSIFSTTLDYLFGNETASSTSRSSGSTSDSKSGSKSGSKSRSNSGSNSDLKSGSKSGPKSGSKSGSRGPTGYNLYVKSSGIPFKDAGNSWRELSQSEKEKWNNKAKQM